MRTCTAQSTYIYRAPQCISPRLNWDSPTPLAASECALPRTKGWGGTLVCCKRGGGVPIPTTGVTLSTLPTLLCTVYSGESTWAATYLLKKDLKNVSERKLTMVFCNLKIWKYSIFVSWDENVCILFSYLNMGKTGVSTVMSIECGNESVNGCCELCVKYC